MAVTGLFSSRYFMRVYWLDFGLLIMGEYCCYLWCSDTHIPQAGPALVLPLRGHDEVRVTYLPAESDL